MTKPGKNNKMLWPTMFLSLALFVGIFIFMFARLGYGSDPAVGAVHSEKAQVITVHKVITRKKIIWKDAPRQSTPDATAPTPTYSAPSEPAPVQTYTPPPAPPAPVQTQSS